MNSLFSLLRVCIATTTMQVAAFANTQGGEPTSEPMDLTPFRVEPTLDKPEEIKLGFDAVDREIQRLRQVNERRRGSAKAETEARLEQIARMRAELGRDFTNEGWDQLTLAMLGAIEANRIEATKFDDATIWTLSRNSAFLKAGHVTVLELCAPCHLPTLKGQSSEGFGPDLTDTVWLHGGRPEQVHYFISTGAFDRGMPPWASIIGVKKVLEVTAYVMSKHREGEPIVEHGMMATSGVTE